MQFRYLSPVAIADNNRKCCILKIKTILSTLTAITLFLSTHQHHFKLTPHLPYHRRIIPQQNKQLRPNNQKIYTNRPKKSYLKTSMHCIKSQISVMANKRNEKPWEILNYSRIRHQLLPKYVNLIALYNGILEQVAKASPAVACLVGH